MTGWVLSTHARDAMDPVADHNHSGRITNSLGDDALSRVFSQNDDATCPAQGPAMQAFPKPDPPGGLNDTADNRHFRIEVANVVNERLPFPKHRHESAPTIPSNGRVGHCHNHVPVRIKRAHGTASIT